MKQLTDTERLKVAMSLLNRRQIDKYAKRCSELEHDCERNGFYNVPAECEGLECGDCHLSDYDRRAVDCPYID